MASTTQATLNNFRKAYPDDLILVYTFKPPGGCSSYHGTQLVNIKLETDKWLRVYKLKGSSGPVMNSDDIKAKAFPFVYDTKSIKDDEKRRDSLTASLKNAFPQHNINVFIFNKSWSRNAHSRGAASFLNEYGSDVDVVLS